MIHPGQADLREALDLLARPDDLAAAALAARARRVLEAAAAPEPAGLSSAITLRRLIRVQRGAPLHDHSPPDFDRDRQKRHLALWPRQQTVTPRREIGVFLHLYHADLAAQFARALEHLEAPYRLYLSTDSAEKAEALAAILPQAETRILPNRGRDIWPKLYGFADRYADHDLVLHLHGKRSAQAPALSGWLSHILASLLPAPPLLRRLLSLFETVPQLGMISPSAYRPTIASAHWGDNFEIARELAARMRLTQPLPGNERLDFPSGSMFWARSKALAPLVDLALPATAFPPEHGQMDGTPAHAIERLFGIVCQQQGFDIVPVAPPQITEWPNHRLSLKRNGELKNLLESGRFQDAAIFLGSGKAGASQP